ncbi:conserved protein of unknown function (plasmid) [Pararobbsia alpina]
MINEPIPSVLKAGTPHEADLFLLRQLWTEPNRALLPTDVQQWQSALRKRGDEFARHVICCFYWLHEYAAGIQPQ